MAQRCDRSGYSQWPWLAGCFCSRADVTPHLHERASDINHEGNRRITFMGFYTYSEATNASMYALITKFELPWSELRQKVSEFQIEEIFDEYFGDRLLKFDIDEAISQSFQEISELKKKGIEVATVLSPEYPPQLRQVHDNPPLLFLRGKIDPQDSKSVAVVGTRTPSAPAILFASNLAKKLGELKIPLVSGLARGIDSVAMKSSVDAGNRTIGVIGTGLDKYYPPENKELQDEIAQNYLLISQFEPQASPTKRSFPMRNVVMSGFSGVTVIVEAGEHSGTKIQSRAAIGHGRPLVITKAVATQTHWGAELAASERANLRVVSDVDGALTAISELINLGSVKTLEPMDLVGATS